MGDWGIPKPLMPLGVEHTPELIAQRSEQEIPKPLMPLGVEHLEAAQKDAALKGHP